MPPVDQQTDQQDIYVALGGNLENPLHSFITARKRLARHPSLSVVRSSPVYRTPAIGGPEGQPDYLNAVLELRGNLTAPQLLAVCQQIETDCGRTREQHWGPRTLDLDILFYGEQHCESPQLTLPHPRLQDRHFVLLPLADLRDDLYHPVLKCSVAQLLQRLPPACGIRKLHEQW